MTNYSVFVIAVLVATMMIATGCISEVPKPETIDPQYTQPQVVQTIQTATPTPIVVVSTTKEPNENSIVGNWISQYATLTIKKDGTFRSTGFNVVGGTSLDDGVWINDGRVCSIYFNYYSKKYSSGITESVSAKCVYNPRSDVLQVSTKYFVRN